MHVATFPRHNNRRHTRCGSGRRRRNQFARPESQHVLKRNVIIGVEQRQVRLARDHPVTYRALNRNRNRSRRPVALYHRHRRHIFFAHFDDSSLRFEFAKHLRPKKFFCRSAWLNRLARFQALVNQNQFVLSIEQLIEFVFIELTFLLLRPKEK